MKPAQYRPTVEEMVTIFGAIKDDSKPGMVGIIFMNRIIWANVRDLTLTDEQLGKGLIEAQKRRLARQHPMFDPPDPRLSLAKPGVIEEVVEEQEDIQPTPTRPLGEAPKMGFIPDDPIEVEEEEPLGDSGGDPTPVEVDMGRAAEVPEKKILGEEEAETLEVPGFLSTYRATGDMSKHAHEKVEVWES
jgi:Fe2+ transport system protein FeoA